MLEKATRMQTKKFVFQVTGHSCSGKSTIGKLVREAFPGMYHVAYDKQKWLLSGYNRNTDREFVKTVVFGLFETVLKTGVPINLELFRTKETYEQCVALAAKYGYSFYTFELTAPYGVLIERFRERVQSAAQKGNRISMTTEELFKENYDLGYFIPSGSPVFDTTHMNEEEISQAIIAILNEK